MQLSLKKHLFGILFGGLLFGFTVYVLLDTFVIVRKYETVEQAELSSAEAESETILAEETAAPSDAETPVTVSASAADADYADANITIRMNEYRVGDTTVYVADVTLASADYLKTAFAQSTYGRNVTEKTSSIAASVNAILAINGDYYGAQQSGYVIRNGVLYRSRASRDAEDLVIFKDGSFTVISESEITAEALLEAGAWNVLSFGPALVADGEIAVSVNDEVGRAKASNPRTAIGVIDDLHYVFAVSDGRTSESEGLSLYELAVFLQSLGVRTAYNLDGGGSSSMVFLGQVVNNPTTGGNRISERSVSDIVYIGY